MSEANGRLPVGWSWATGRDLFEFLRGISYKKADVLTAPLEDSVTILRAGNLQDGRIVFDDLVHIPASYVHEEQRIRKSDLIIAMSSGSASVVGKVAVADKDMLHVSFGAFCGLLRPRTKEYSHWLSEFFQTKDYRDLISSLAAGININNLRPEHLYTLSVPVPPLSEMQRLEKKIETLQERSRRVREALSEVGPLLEQFRQSVLAASFRGDLTADWRAAHPNVEPASELLQRIRLERRRLWEQAEHAKYGAKGQKRRMNWLDKYKEPEPVDDSDLPELPDGWRWVSLDEVAYLMRSGNAKTSLKAPTNWPILRSSAVRPGLIDFGDVNYMAEDEGEESENVLSEGDLMVTRLSGSLDYVGVCAIVHGLDGRRIQYPDRLFRVRLCKSLVTKYIEFCFRYQPLRVKLEISAKSSAGHQRISLSDLRSFRFPLPPYDEQDLIAKTLAQVFASALSIGDECSAIAEQADLLDQAILAKAFRGELVPQAPSDEPASALLERIRARRTQRAKSAKQTSNGSQKSKIPKKLSELTPQQLTLAEVLTTQDQ